MKRKILFISLAGLISFFAINLNAQITSFPYAQDFDSWTTSGGTGCGGVVTLEEGWTNLTGDDFDWDINSGVTPNYSTGPSGDHTGGGNYLYTESTSCINSLAEITSPLFNLTVGPVSPELRFWYHMYGNTMGTLEVMLSDDGGASWSPAVWIEAGDIGDIWKEVSIDISSYSLENDFRVKFSGKTGPGVRSDMAIDDITIDEPGPPFYCESEYTSPWTNYINAVTFNTITNNNSGPTGYGNFTDQSTDVALSSIYTLTIDAAMLIDPTVLQVWAWIDWNQNGNFTDVGEAHDLGQLSYKPDPPVQTISLAIPVPAGATLGTTRMRVIVEKNNSVDPDPCGGGLYGETEDYSINVVDPTSFNNWLGITSDVWNTASNWSSGLVPDETVDVIIGGGASNYPVIIGNHLNIGNSGAFSCKSMIIENGGTVTIDYTQDIYINGNITINTGGTLSVGNELWLSGGNLFILGGTVKNNYNVGTNGKFRFNAGGGYMTEGSLIIYSKLWVASNSPWYASGGVVHCGGTNSAIDIRNRSADFYLQDLVIDEDVTASISSISTKLLNINGDFTMEPGSRFSLPQASLPNIAEVYVGDNFIMQSDATRSASFIDNGTFVTSGNIELQKYIEADRYHYFSSPVSSETANMFLDMYLYSFDESTYNPGPPAAGGWENIVEETTPLEIGVGYKVWSFSPNLGPGSTIVSFTNGTLNNGFYNLPVYATDQNGGGIGDGEGWNLVGNPYPSAVNWTAAGWTKTNLSGSVYVYDGVQYLAWPAEGGYGTLPDGIIPAMQSFFVKANTLIPAPALSVTNDARVHGATAYKETTVLEDVLQLTVTGNEYQDITFVSFNEMATESFDDQYDAYKLMGSSDAPQLYSIGDNNYTINVQPTLSGEVTIHLGFNVGVEGVYEITPDEISSFDPDTEIFLEDLKEDVMVDLKVQQEYAFFATPEDNTERFILHFYKSAAGIDNSLLANNNGFVIYSDNQTVMVKNTENVYCDVAVYDIMGHQVGIISNTNNSDIELNLNAEQGFYIVKVLTQAGLTSKKVYIK